LTPDYQKGLTTEQVKQLQEKYGANKLKEKKKKTNLQRFAEQFKDAMILILIAAAVISFIVACVEGEPKEFFEPVLILVIVILNAVMGVMQESKAEKALDALKNLSAPHARVIRDGVEQVIDAAELVPGDIIKLEAGDFVPADAKLIKSVSLKSEESALTGESVPAEKDAEAIVPEDAPLGDRHNMVFSGCGITYGTATAVVTGTGMDTEMGKIADALANAEEGQTPLQIKLSQLSKILTWLVLGICVIIFIVQILRAGKFSFEPILNSFMVAVSLAVAAIPEGLAAVVTVVLSIGVTNMSKRNAIIRRLTAVETLGCAQIICSDKTGTLTQNKMTVVDFFGEDEKYLAQAMALCCDAELAEDGAVNGEPTEAALVVWANKLDLPKYDLKAKYPRSGEAPFDSGRKLMSTVHPAEGKYIQYTKGAPDVILDRCTTYLKDGKPVPMTDEYRQEILKGNKAMADRALRVLACAQRIWDAEPASYDADVLEYELCFVGLSGMIDPVRPEVADAIVQCKGAGITAIMITGDHIDTAMAIAKELGILTADKKAITGSMLNEMDDETFAKEFKNIAVYARVQPEHKTRIVNAWRAAGYVTAMTGDGVNDAPSIKSADIGVGMGITGTDVTKNVADMVLTDDNFATIVGAVEEGRRIYDNIRKAIQFLLGSNMSEVISIFTATLLGFTILKPVHLLWINLVTDCFPALALGMEEAEPDIMERSPRDAKAGIFSGGMGFDIGYQGIMVSVLVLISYFVGHFIESSAWEIADSADGMTMAFLTMSMAEIFHSFNMRSQRGSIFRLPTQNKLLIGAAIATLIATTLVCEVPFLANAFGFSSVSLVEYVIAIGLGVLVLPIVEIVKFFQRKGAKK